MQYIVLAVCAVLIITCAILTASLKHAHKRIKSLLKRLDNSESAIERLNEFARTQIALNEHTKGLCDIVKSGLDCTNTNISGVWDNITMLIARLEKLENKG